VFIGAVVDASISNGGDGTAQSSGVFSVPAALQVGTWTAGDRIYLATTVAGKYTNAVTVTVGEVLVPIGRSLDTPAGGAANVLIILESLEVII
jgi:predicted RecA/RadA family phage recombinase